MIFVDSNIPMYLIGREHPLKTASQRAVADAKSAGESLVTSAEVFQEICHRFHAIARRDLIQPGFDVLDAMVDRTYSVERIDAEGAKDLLGTHAGLSARDALHVALMRRHGIEQVMSFDSAFDAVAGIRRRA